MKVLQLCNKPPFPSKDGGCIAMKNIAVGLLSKNIDLKLLTIETQKHPFILDAFPKNFIHKTQIESVFVDTRVNVVDAFSALVTSDSYNVSRFFSADFDKKLKEILEEEHFDVVHLESLFLTPYIGTIRKYSKAKLVLRSHNLEHLIWERLANLEKNKAKKIYLKHLSKKLKKYEKGVLCEVDAIATISSEDTKRFNSFDCEKPLKTIPFGIDLENYSKVEAKYGSGLNLKLFHIGSMDWMPNTEAVNWFLDDVFSELSEVELHLAGKNMPTYMMQNDHKNLFVSGEVESAIDFMAKFDVMIVPLLSGSGMRIKIIEAMALGKTVVTTSIGIEGINAEDGTEVLIANTTKEFVQQINKLKKNPKLVASIGQNARQFIERNHSNSNIIDRLIDLYKL